MNDEVEEMKLRLDSLEDAYDQLSEILFTLCKAENKPERKKAEKKEPVKIPKGWMFVTEFADKFAFASLTSVYKIIHETEDFLKEHTLRFGNKMYMNPAAFVNLFERELVKSVRLNNAYQSWKRMSSELKAIADRSWTI